jgi:hypothetical protein
MSHLRLMVDRLPMLLWSDSRGPLDASRVIGVEDTLVPADDVIKFECIDFAGIVWSESPANMLQLVSELIFVVGAHERLIGSTRWIGTRRSLICVEQPH